MISVRTKGQNRVLGALTRLAQRISDFRGKWERHIDIRLRHQREWLDSRGNDTWPKLTDLYLERKSRDPGAAFLEVLQLTGHLYRSLTSAGAADSIIEEHESRLVMGTSDPKARWHHEGKGRLPVRHVIVIGDDERRDHQEALYESILEDARSEGFRVVN